MKKTAESLTEAEIGEFLRSVPLFGNREHEIIAYAALFPAQTKEAKRAVMRARAELAAILNGRARKGQ